MAILRDNWIVIAIGVAIIAALVLLVWVWWWIPKLQMRGRIFRGEKERADAEDNFRKTVGQALGGAVVLIGAGLAYLQFTQQQQTQQQVADISRKAAPDLLISNQVAKGFEQLAGEKPAMRLGGIYGLEGVMNTSPQYSQPVLEALCAFVRDSTIGAPAGHGPTTEIQAALTVISRRVDGLGSVDLIKANIPEAKLLRAKLNGMFPNHTDLSGADLSDADLTGADLSGADLISAMLNGAVLNGADLRNANLSGASLFHAHLTDALNRMPIQANLRNANLSGAVLASADLHRADLGGATLNDAMLHGADLTGADLSGADLSGGL